MTKKVTKTKVAAKKTTKKTTVKKTVPVLTPIVVPQPVAPSVVMPVKTEAEKIWEEIRDLPIEMFGLPNQVIAMHANPIMVEPSRLYLLIRSTATLPSLEASVVKKFSVELADKFVIVTRLPQPFVLPKR